MGSTKLYSWNVYSVGTTTTKVMKNTGTAEWYDGSQIFSILTWEESSIQWRCTSDSRVSYNTSSGDYGKFWFIVNNTGATMRGKVSTKALKYEGVRDSEYRYKYSVWRVVSETSYVKGNTSYGSITNSYRNAYPNNNKQGDRWYVYSGTK